MNELRVHFGYPLPDETRSGLEAVLVDGVEITVGREPPSDARYEVLVSGRPSRESLAASPALHTLLIPWAGLSAGVAEVLGEFPQVSVHNLHHNADPTAEHALMLLLAAAKRVVPNDRRMRAHDWKDRGRDQPAILLAGKRALVLGHGAIGRRLMQLCRAIGMTAGAVSRSGADPDAHPVSQLHELLPAADALLVTLPLTPETRGLIGREELALLPRGAVLVNVGRGPVVDESALYDALASGHLHGAGLDVWYRYPKPDDASSPPSDRPFEELDNVVMTPHRAGAVDATERLRVRELARVLNALARGEEVPNRVDLLRGY